MDIFERANRALSGVEMDEDFDEGLGSKATASKFKAPRAPDTVRFSNHLLGRSKDFRIDKLRPPKDERRLPPKMHALADAIGFYVTKHLNHAPSTPVRPPSHACPPVRSLDFDIGVNPAADYTVLNALSTNTTAVASTLKGGWYGVILGFAFTIGWDSASPPVGNPYLSTRVSLRINSVDHEVYRQVTLQLTPSLQQLVPVMIPIPGTQNNQSGATISLVFENTHGTEASRIAGRIKGYQFPVSGAAEGIFGGLVEG